jgi:hypothetical protein
MWESILIDRRGGLPLPFQEYRGSASETVRIRRNKRLLGTPRDLGIVGGLNTGISPHNLEFSRQQGLSPRPADQTLQSSSLAKKKNPAGLRTSGVKSYRSQSVRS